MPAQSKDASQAPAHPKRVRRTEAEKMVKNLAPKARNGYALFMQSRYPEVQAGFQIEKGSPGRKQRDVIKAIGVEWQLLSQEEKKGWGDQAAKEKSAQQEAIQRILPASSSKQKSDRVVDLVQPITKGGYSFDARGSESQGAAVYWFPARHVTLGVKATAAMFKHKPDFLREVQVMKELASASDIVQDVYMLALFLDETCALNCLLVDPLPTMQEYVADHGGLQLDMIAAVTKQMAVALNQLHDKINLLHCDIKPKAIWYDSQKMLARLGRFALARGLGEGADVEAYTGNYRAPELWSGPHKMPSLSTESWALGCTLAEISSGNALFQSVSEIANYKSDLSERQLQQSYPTLAKLAPRVRVLVQLLVHESADCRKAIKDLATDATLMEWIREPAEICP